MKTKSSIELLESRIAPAVFTVTTLADTGGGSLRAAIDAANDLDGADKIVFANSVKGDIEFASQIDITESVKIVGNGKVVLSGMWTTRIFEIDDANDGEFSGVKISNIMLKDATVTGAGGDGGAILSKENLTLKNATFIGNSASEDGGAVSCTDGKLTIIGSQFSNNSAGGDGGAIFFEGGTLLMSESRLTDNSASSEGGGIYAYGKSLTVSNCVISGNTSGSGGGGLYFDYDSSSLTLGTVTISGTKFISNKATGNGGGAYIDNAFKQITISSSNFKTNESSDDGGGLMLYGKEDQSSKLAGVKFIGNVAGDEGGGLYASYGLVTVVNSTFKFNEAATKGGGIHIYSDLDAFKMKTSSVRENIAATSGGGIFNGMLIEAKLVDSVVKENVAPADPDLSGLFTIV